MSTMSATDVLHADFEAWHRREFPSILVRWREDLGTYSDYGVECAWCAWQAAVSMRGPVRDGIIEECAQICERLHHRADPDDQPGRRCAAALRARKGQPA
ncbi:hypothetical protein [Paraburkholderia sp. MM6662-R1]|uniref:hypothetical protein n=1 Tax=Paraburkholderia sp. MM6662-R1 TaxID=2991066 RepID=UPI003D2211F3